ncbi:Longitudinals lacking protein-like [Frankliniella fusca]|uniref:Longitudinals lacking protein-like n=1 Tax=Frankliniella fusca TaxID=407009 RepID=A0AAE1HH12_9NEOP|nr:Longitudinals lacking protein-like [Frankliniella fusca]
MTAIDAEQFSLRWNNFHNNLTAGFHDLLLGEDLVDVTIAAEGKFVQAHKMVLSVCSPYFKDLFKVNPCKHPIVILKDTGYKEIEALLQFMYRGEVNVRQEELAMFLKTAEMLQIKGLTGSESKKDSAEPSSNRPSSNSAPSRTHSLPQDTSTHPPPKRKRSEVPPLPSTSAPTTPSQVVDVTPQTPPEGPSNDQALQDGNDFINMMNPKLEPQEYDESEDGLDMMADDAVGHDPLVQQLLGGADPKGMAGLGNFVGLPGMKDGNVGQDGGQGGDAHFLAPTSSPSTSTPTPTTRFIRSRKGGKMLVHDGFVYFRECRNGNQADRRHSWRCHEYHKMRCKGRCVTVDDVVTRITGGHNHQPDLADIARREEEERLLKCLVFYLRESWKVVVNCNLCGKVLKRGSLRKHMVDRHSDNVHASACQYCNKHFRTANSLSNHLSLYHRELTQAAKKMRQPGLVTVQGPGQGATVHAAVLGAGVGAGPGVAVGMGPAGPAAVPVIMQMQPPVPPPVPTPGPPPPQYLPMATLEVNNPLTPSPVPSPVPTPAPAPVSSGPAYLMATRYITCHLCGKTMRKASLRRHMEDRHMPNHRSNCPHCPKTFRTSNSLQNHLSLYHRNFRRKRMGMVRGHPMDPMDEQQQQQMNQLSQQINQHLSQQINQQLNQHLNQQLGQYDQLDQRQQEQLRIELEMRRKQDGRLETNNKQERVLDDIQQISQHINQQLGHYDQLDQMQREQLRLELEMRRKQDARVDSNRPEHERSLEHDVQDDQHIHQPQSHSLPPVSASLQSM